MDLLAASFIRCVPLDAVFFVLFIVLAPVTSIGPPFSTNTLYVFINVLNPFPIAINKSNIPPIQGISAKND